MLDTEVVDQPIICSVNIVLHIKSSKNYWSINVLG